MTEVFENWRGKAGCEGPDLDVLEESALARAQATIQRAMNESGISRADLARQMERPRSFVSRMLTGSHNLTVRTMARSLFACGYEVDFGLSPIAWNWVHQPEAQAIDYMKGTPSQEGTLLLANYSPVEACPLAV